MLIAEDVDGRAGEMLEASKLTNNGIERSLSNQHNTVGCWSISDICIVE